MLGARRTLGAICHFKLEQNAEQAIAAHRTSKECRFMVERAAHDLAISQHQGRRPNCVAHRGQGRSPAMNIHGKGAA